MAKRAKKEFGIDLKNESQKNLLLQGLMTGVWTSHTAKEKFVIEHFLPQAMKDGML